MFADGLTLEQYRVAETINKQTISSSWHTIQFRFRVGRPVNTAASSSWLRWADFFAFFVGFSFVRSPDASGSVSSKQTNQNIIINRIGYILYNYESY